MVPSVLAAGVVVEGIAKGGDSVAPLLPRE